MTEFPFHTRVGWYEECVDHPRPDTDAPDDVWDVWADGHFEIYGTEYGDSMDTCEANRVADVCRECTDARREAEETDEVYVPWPCSAAQEATA